jgi:hypothetical protein
MGRFHRQRARFSQWTASLRRILRYIAQALPITSLLALRFTMLRRASERDVGAP